MRKWILFVTAGIVTACGNKPIWNANATVTSADGDKWEPISSVIDTDPSLTLTINPKKEYQEIVGMGGAFTESSAALLNALSDELYDSVISAYFGAEGCKYSLTRTHIASCDFSLGSYSYAEVPGDTNLEHFSIDPDRDDLIPMIKRAQELSHHDFKIMASPWSAPPWMKTNQHYFGGELLPEYYPTWADYFTKYIQAYAEEGIPIWAITVENEPLGNDAHWESMHYTPETMGEFVADHLGPAFEKSNIDAQIYLYDQNRGEELVEWGEALLNDEEVTKYADGMAVHWYNSTYHVFPESLDAIHEMRPDLHLIQTEGCVDADVPAWKDDAWYWDTTATDWGFQWAKEENKYLHRPYVPSYRYARDIIGCLNHWVEGWIDWNMVLDQNGGPNHVENWCAAPVLADTTLQEVYFTPLYYVMGQFTRYIEPGAKRIDFNLAGDSHLRVTAVQNPKGDIAVFILNEGSDEPLRVQVEDEVFDYIIPSRSIQTIHLNREIE